MRQRIALALLGLCFLSAASAGEPDWLVAARAREGQLRPSKKVKSTDGFFHAQVPAKVVGKIVPDDETYLLRLDVQAGTPVECVVLRHAQDLASFLVGTSNSAYEMIEPPRGKVAAKAVERVDAGAIGASPFLAVDWTHRIEAEGQEPAVGALKQIAASKDGHTVYCVHNEVGYSQTFRKLAEALVSSITFDDTPKTRPYRSEVSTLTLQGMRVAVDEVTYTKDKDGDTQIQHTSAMLLPVGGETLSASDELMIQWVRPDGSLINALQIESDNGQIATQLKLDPRDDGSWSVSGTFKSKPLTVEVPPGAPSTMLSDVIQLRSKMTQQNPVGSVMKVETWLPGVDPSKLLAQELKILRAIDDDRFVAKLEMGGIVADIVVDRSGNTLAGKLTMGPMKMEIEQVFADGAI
jgi:hypothetical protein